MKIFIRDDDDHKISHRHIDHWQKAGHEIDWDMYPDLEKMAWSDVTVSFWCDQYAQIMAMEKGKQKMDTKLIVQCVDLDAWAGHWGTVEWQHVDHLVFMSQHIQTMVMDHLGAKFSDEDFKKENPDLVLPPVHYLPLGIDVRQWKFRDRSKDHKKVMGFIAAEWWSAKNPAMVIELMAELVRRDPAWRFKWVGRFGSEQWLRASLLHLIEQNGLEDHVEVDFNAVEDIDAWWDDIDYFVTFSMKDSYSLIVGEAMAKGIKTFVHNFWDATNIWDKQYVWSNLHELVEKIEKDDYSSRKYRNYIQRKHRFAPILKKWDKLLVS